MTVAICVYRQLDSREKGEKFRGLLRDVAKATLSDEPDNKAYCWFRKSQSNTLPGEWICGFELADENLSYENEAALVETHRSGAEYQRMRKVVAEEELLGKTYPQIILLKPAAPSGFINRGSTATVLDESDQSLVLISQYKYRAESMQNFLAEIEHMTQACHIEPKVLAYYPMLRKDGESSVLTIFERYASENAHRRIKEALDPLIARLAALSDEIVVTTWGHGFGHLKSISSNFEL
ncbi:uncharacterized protein Z519_11249 [Cladophialophora bantiana CBS 173.52]|uniref:ABM domain-containing protein n=1 Tax=Cladophialophora bantiana (strain ATCC 10958 / CBS 173.52 / CDC B-1940 / NIH 8579) TaxID=1442370 RepID=A0A0D2H4D0_CLAB1|nr:uncharacterized protein Z519_11249 [Cladophialophora bantiana CBS 173.52]KIW88138.1 hypothetical protein Z519_11249 [Cladophialophora bantiana CBS 173.52]